MQVLKTKFKGVTVHDGKWKFEFPDANGFETKGESENYSLFIYEGNDIVATFQMYSNCYFTATGDSNIEEHCSNPGKGSKHVV